MKHLVLAICGVAMIGCSGEKAKAPEKPVAPEYFKVDAATRQHQRNRRLRRKKACG